jgi:endonuclease/exonuclease/phosphatase (EEP) superfamily protein YafD
MAKTLSRMVPVLILLAMLAVAAAIAAGFFGHLHPALDSFAHFRAHLAVLLGLVSLPLFATRFLKIGATGLLYAILAFATTSGTVPIPELGVEYGPLHAGDPQDPSYRLLQLNLLFNNPQPELVLSLIGRVQPDVLTLEEISPLWTEKLKLVSARYPYSIFCPDPEDYRGVAILSRRPFRSGTQPSCDGQGALAIASIDFGGQNADIAALHLSWPWPRKQYWEIDGLRTSFEKIGASAILAGDLNAVPWSRTPARVAAYGGLTLMPSPGPTWLFLELPRTLLFAGLPIDQVFAKGDVRVHSIERLDAVGSDHSPLLVEFSMKRAPAPAQVSETDLALAD